MAKRLAPLFSRWLWARQRLRGGAQLDHLTIYPFVLLGALPAALLAVLLDYVLGRLERALTPRGLLPG